MPKLALPKAKLPKIFTPGALPLWPVVSLLLLTITLSYLNYEPGTWLTGWDNLHPEFNLPMNIQRSLFAVWQEYQSLGLLGGMSHASDLLHQLFLLLLSNLGIPAPLLRYLYTFLMLSLGPIGVYAFITSHLLQPYAVTHPNKYPHPLIKRLADRLLNKPLAKAKVFDRQTRAFAGFMGGLFYLLNLATMQAFFTPFECFITFYGFFPWIIFALLSYLKNPNRQSFLFLSLILFLSAPGYYIETLFVVLGLSLLPFIIENLTLHNFSLKSFRTNLISLLTLLITQGYWLFPVIFFVLTNGHVGEQAKINLISSSETYQRNLEYANVFSLIYLKGFWFSFVDLGPTLKFDYLMPAWRHHLQNPVILIVGAFNFVLILTGIFYALKKRLNFAHSVLATMVITLFFLLGGGLLINNHLPLIGELFRSPFTKFSTPLSFTYSVFFSVGTIFLLDLFSFLHTRLTYYLTLFTVTFGLIIFTAPAFTGNLVSPSMRRTIPSEYFQVFDFFKSQDPATRIANLPQHTYWGWLFYNWGYRGSGFLWYGIRQPILDRAFDVWEKSSEKYYDEMSTAIYSQDQKTFEQLVDKYSVNWLMVDKNIINPDNSSSLYTNQVLDLINSSDKFELALNANDKILIYRTNLQDKTQNFLSLKTTNLSQTLFDFSLRPQSDWELQGNSLITTPTAIAPHPQELKLTLPSYHESEKLIPARLYYRKNNGQLDIKISPLSPQLLVNSDIHTLETRNAYISLPLPNDETGYILQAGDQYFEFQIPAEVNNQNDYLPFVTTHLPVQKTTPIALYSNSTSYSTELTDRLSSSNPQQCYIKKPDRKIEKIVDGSVLTLIGTDVVGCLSTKLPSISGLISVSFEYNSPTGTPANATITNDNLENFSPPAPILAASKTFQYARIFTPSYGQAMTLNLLLEAHDSTSTREINYRNVSISTHPLIASQSVNLLPTANTSYTLKPTTQNTYIRLVLPVIESYLSPRLTPQNNILFPTALNCNNFSTGQFSKTITSSTIEYASSNAIGCDFASFPQLTHQTAYALVTSAKLKSGLPLVFCLENYDTRRCDIYERLYKNAATQTIISPIVNPNLDPGYTLHLYNQSFYPGPTRNAISDLLITPIPLNFAHDIRLFDPNSQTYDLPEFSSYHPAEFYYTISLSSTAPLVLNHYQTASPYWKALEVPSDYLKLALWQQLALLPVLLQSRDFQPLPPSPELFSNRPTYWHNSWALNAGEHNILIIYLPQYLEFFGFFILISLPILLLIHPPLIRRKNIFTQPSK